MNKTGKIIVGVVVIIVVIALIVWGILETKQPTGPATGEPIKIGWIGSLTGDVANLGENARAATEIAVAEVNAAGGINGRPLELIYEDGKCSGKESINAANKLINIDNVNVIIGGLCSGETAGFVKTAMEQKRIVFSYCSSNPALSNSGAYFFRDYPSDNFQGGYAANYIYNDLGKRKMAVIFVQNDWGVGIKDVFVKKFKDLGGQILAEEPVNQGDKDLKTQLTKIKELKPELIYFLGLTEETIAGLRQARELDINIPFFGGDPWDETRIWESLDKMADGAMYTIPYAPLNDHFKKAMQEKLGKEDILMCSPGAYDAVKILSMIIARVGVDPDKIKNELHNMKPYTQGVSGQSISFDQNGDMKEASYMVKIIKDGKAVEHKK